MAENGNLNSAKVAKNDEFYTQLTDIEKELKHYKHHFKNKIVFCNCDDPEWSNFWKYFYNNFNTLGLKKLISTHYEKNKQSYKLEYDGLNIAKTMLQSDGDFRSDECVEVLKGSDIVVTNPPFSLFSSFISLLIKYNKDFIVLGNKNGYTYSGVFPHIKSGKIKIGATNRTGGMWMIMPQNIEIESSHAKENKDVTLVNVSGVRWFTTLSCKQKTKPIELTCTYSEEKYLKYDNYDAINVDKTADIPKDYTGIMGVPVSFLDKYCDEQFLIIGATESEGKGFSCGLWDNSSSKKQAMVNGVAKYKRIFIRFKNVQSGVK